MLSAGSGCELPEDRLEAVEGDVVDLREEVVLVPGELVCGSDVVEVPELVLLLPGDPDALEDRERLVGCDQVFLVDGDLGRLVLKFSPPFASSGRGFPPTLLRWV
ncbi:hypothetical protein ACIOWI_36885 [Streptomyces sp. NPDC087659]|uniref:hypothetical protein n=1 Tax=Streptomyces sp. NPDC087659 TaxID=3365801 RepID=UPI0037F719D6